MRMWDSCMLESKDGYWIPQFIRYKSWEISWIFLSLMEQLKGIYYNIWDKSNCWFFSFLKIREMILRVVRRFFPGCQNLSGRINFSNPGYFLFAMLLPLQHSIMSIDRTYFLFWLNNNVIILSWLFLPNLCIIEFKVKNFHKK